MAILVNLILFGTKFTLILKGFNLQNKMKFLVLFLAKFPE